MKKLIAIATLLMPTTSFAAAAGSAAAAAAAAAAASSNSNIVGTEISGEQLLVLLGLFFLASVIIGYLMNRYW